MVYDRKAQVLSLQKISDDEYQWLPESSAWVNIERQNKTNLFSKIGIGVPSALFTLQPRPLTLHHALHLGGRHYFLTFIDQRNVVKLEAVAAEVEPQRCVATRWVTTKNQQKNPVSASRIVAAFPAVLLEKYNAFKQEEPMAQTELTLVLVTPKPIVLKAGDLVEAEEGTFAVRLCHTQDRYKNEYEVHRKDDA